MPLEIEVKLRVADHQPIREALTRAGATFVGHFHETNIFFDRPDRSLRAADTGLRIRLWRKESEPETAALLTFKGPPQSTPLRPREAFDLALTPADQALPLLKALGFEQVLSFEKCRESWELSDCKVELDTLPVLGTFLEIEGPTEAAVLAVQQTLKLENLPPVRPSYSAMMSEYADKTKLPNRTITFS